MRKIRYIFVFFLVLLMIYFFLRTALPKYTGFLPFFMILLALDGYLWASVRVWVFSRKRWAGYLLTGFYWLPAFLLLVSILAGIFVAFIDWNVVVRTYIPGFIAIFYVSKIFPIVFLLLADIIRIFRCGWDSFLNGFPIRLCTLKKVKGLLITGWVIGSFIFVLLVSGMFIWAYDFKVTEVNISLPELPAPFNGFKIVQLSDIHLGSWGCRSELRKAIAITDSLHPDVIFFTGDLANYSTADVRGFIPLLEGLHAREGIFACMGNHDYGDYVPWPTKDAKEKNLQELYRIYAGLGWKLLLNEHYFLHRGDDSIAIIGVQNWGATRRFQRLGDIGKALKGAENVAVQLLLSHDPTHWDRIVSQKYPSIDITFAGHIHGFQFGIETRNFRWSPAQYMYKEWAGLYSKPVQNSHPQYLYINRGLGSIGYPGRVGIRPEITVITLRR